MPLLYQNICIRSMLFWCCGGRSAHDTPTSVRQSFGNCTQNERHVQCKSHPFVVLTDFAATAGFARRLIHSSCRAPALPEKRKYISGSFSSFLPSPVLRAGRVPDRSSVRDVRVLQLQDHEGENGLLWSVPQPNEQASWWVALSPDGFLQQPTSPPPFPEECKRT